MCALRAQTHLLMPREPVDDILATRPSPAQHGGASGACLHLQLGGIGLPPTVMGHAHIEQVLAGIQAYLHSHNATHLWHEFLEILELVTPPQAQGLLFAHDNLLPSYIGADAQTHLMGLWGLEAHLATWLHVHVNVATNEWFPCA